MTVKFSRKAHPDVQGCWLKQLTTVRTEYSSPSSPSQKSMKMSAPKQNPKSNMAFIKEIINRARHTGAPAHGLSAPCSKMG